MSPRRAVLLTLLGVIMAVALAAAGYFVYRGYDRYQDALNRADKAEARTAKAEARLKRESGDARYQQGLTEGIKMGRKGAFELFGQWKDSTWYAVLIKTKRDETFLPGVRIDDRVEMQPCREYWWTGTSEEIWTRRQDRADC